MYIILQLHTLVIMQHNDIMKIQCEVFKRISNGKDTRFPGQNRQEKVYVADYIMLLENKHTKVLEQLLFCVQCFQFGYSIHCLVPPGFVLSSL